MRWECHTQRRNGNCKTIGEETSIMCELSQRRSRSQLQQYKRRNVLKTRNLGRSMFPFVCSNILTVLTITLISTSVLLKSKVNAFNIVPSAPTQQRNEIQWNKSKFPMSSSSLLSSRIKRRSIRKTTLLSQINDDLVRYEITESSIAETSVRTDSETPASSSHHQKQQQQQQQPPPPPPKEMNKVGFVNGVTSKSGPLNEAVLTILHATKNYTDYTLQDANELITMGAVWARMETLSSDEILSLYDTDNEDDARYLYADLPRGWGSGSESEFADDSKGTSSNGSGNNEQEVVEEDDLDAYVQAMAQQRYRRILTPSSITAGIDLRIYPKPRRFSSCYDIQSNNLLYEDTTFIVVDKPPMLPTQPDASNYMECCPSCVNIQLGPFYDILGNLVQRPLLCHRIDTCVGGIVVLSKDSNGQRVFHQYQRERQLRKMYYAVTTQPVPTGKHIHWMWAQQSARSANGGPPCQLVRHTPPDSRRIARTYWNRCVLEVVSSSPIDIDPDTLQSFHLAEDQQYYQSTIRLVTGRKHQVRAQLSSLGCPIINDTLYGPIAGYTLDDLEQSEDLFEQRIANCRVPTQPIGLQAAGILFGGIKVRANPPWWA